MTTADMLASKLAPNASCLGCTAKLWAIKQSDGSYRYVEEFKRYHTIVSDPVTDDIVWSEAYVPAGKHECSNAHRRKIGFKRLDKLIKRGIIIPATGYPENREEFRKRGSDYDPFDFMSQPCSFCGADINEDCSSMARGRLHGNPIRGLHKQRVLATYEAKGYEREFSQDLMIWILRKKA